VRRARQAAERQRVRDLIPFATAVIRDAPNQHEVLDAVASDAGVELGLMSPEDEARLTYAAVWQWLGKRNASMLLLDIGGGTVEIAV
jgi:exopolyphosphatase/guanosine-5'-triphosphate,3'-diphosphate pyrophosphatase